MKFLKPIFIGIVFGLALSLAAFAIAAPTSPTGGGGSPTAPSALCKVDSDTWAFCNTSDTLGDSSNAILNGQFTSLTIGTATISGTVSGNLNITDDNLLLLGTTLDQVMLNRSTTLAADTVLTSVLEGTVEGQAVPANSLLVSNITNDGDINLYVSKAGNSQQVFWADGSTGDTAIMAASGQSVDVYIAGTKEIDYATGAMAFQQATTISTATGALTIDGDDGIVLQTTGSGSVESRDVVVLGTADQGTTARTGQTLRASDMIGGTTADGAGADLTIAAGLGTGIGDVGQIIFQLPQGAAAGTGTDIQTRYTAMTLDSVSNTATETTTLTISSPENTAVAAHSIVDIAVGGTTSTGDPQLRWTVPSGTSWYMGADNSNSDRLFLGTGTVVGTTAYMVLSPVASSAIASVVEFFAVVPIDYTFTSAGALGQRSNAHIYGATVTHAGTTAQTLLYSGLDVSANTIAQSGGAIAIDKATGISSISYTAGASVSITHSSAFRALTGGAAVNVSGLYIENEATNATTAGYGIYIENQTGGAGSEYGLYIAGADTNAIWVDAGTSRFDGRVLQTQGADVASGTNIVLGSDGNVFEITGTTKIDLISSVGWQNGASITLIANENVVIDDGTVTSGTNITINLAGGDYSMTADDTLTLILSETTAGGQAWREVSRSVN